MNIVLLQSKLHLEEIDQLLKEFPQYLFLTVNDASYRKLQEHQREKIEVIYGNRLSKEDLAQSPSLRWIHSPNPQLNRLALQSILDKGSIIVSTTPDENIEQAGEFVIGGILTFVKNFIHWSEAFKFPTLIWDSKWRDDIWTLKNKVLLQIGLRSVGTEIARRARQFDMKVWGMEEKKTFHPHCDKTFDFRDLHSVLSGVDIVSIALPPLKEYEGKFGATEFFHMKTDSILSLIGPYTQLNGDALLAEEGNGKFRGILIDTPYALPIPHTSPLWSLRKAIITPETSPRPKSQNRQAFRLFLYNFRQYVHGNYKDLKNCIDSEN